MSKALMHIYYENDPCDIIDLILGSEGDPENIIERLNNCLSNDMGREEIISACLENLSHCQVIELYVPLNLTAIDYFYSIMIAEEQIYISIYTDNRFNNIIHDGVLGDTYTPERKK